MYTAKRKTVDPDTSTFYEVMHGYNSFLYIEAMKKELPQLMKKHTWKGLPRHEVPPGRKILKSTWAFKLKRLPDDISLEYKARFCVREDLQTDGVDYFETYAPVVQWSTIRLLLTLIL